MLLSEVTYEERVATAIQLRARQAITNQALANAVDVRAITDFTTDRLLIELTAHIAGNVRDEWERVEIRGWASAWDMWKATKCPRWLAPRLTEPQTRSHTRLRRKRWTDLYPELPMPGAAGSRRVFVEQSPND